jgi:uncharacterized DUF497 family protein
MTAEQIGTRRRWHAAVRSRSLRIATEEMHSDQVKKGVTRIISARRASRKEIQTNKVEQD